MSGWVDVIRKALGWLSSVTAETIGSTVEIGDSALYLVALDDYVLYEVAVGDTAVYAVELEDSAL